MAVRDGDGAAPDSGAVFGRVLLKLSGEALLGDREFGADPATNSAAEFIPALTHREAIERDLRLMDSTALSLCMDNNLPIHVFNMDDERNIDRIVCGERVGTVVRTV